ncbi:MAG: hypothetical protein HY961_19890 [Ignavibacteriae bacterium]|nr:hypothetical protein [Ignavibacteriota bacterium]
MGRSTLVSNFSVRVYNDGVIGHNMRTREEVESIWPRTGQGSHVRISYTTYQQCGLWLGCKINGRKVVSPVRVTTQFTGTTTTEKMKFVPGTIGDPNAPTDTAFSAAGWKYHDDPNYVVYSSMDYDAHGVDQSGRNFPDWPIRLAEGRPMYMRDVEVRSRYAPVYRSDEDIFSVYKDTETEADPEFFGRLASPETTSIPIGIEVRQTIFSWCSAPLRDVLLISFQVMNQSNRILEDAYIGFEVWPLILKANAPLDTNIVTYFSGDRSRNLGYQHNPAITHGVRPHLGVALLETPRNSLGTQNGMTFWTEDIYHNYLPRPRMEYTDAFRYDYMARDSIEHLRMHFHGINLPIKNSIFAGSGPFCMLPGDSVILTVALLVGDGLDHLLSIHDLIRRVYANNLLTPQPPKDPLLSYSPLDGAIQLTWNDAAEHSTDPIVPDSLGKPFLGYRLYRARTSEGPYYVLKQWSRGTDSLTHEYLDDGRDGADPTIPQGTKLLNNVRYFYKLTAFDEGAPGLGLSSMESKGRTIEARPGARPRGAGDVSEIRIVPNPLLVTHQAQNSVQSPRIYFSYLPEVCTLRIYTVGLDLVKEIVHTAGTSESWDLRAEAGQQVASQLYIVHFATPNGRTAVRKFAVVTGE